MNIREYSPADKPQIIHLMTEFGAYLESLDPLNRTKFAPDGSVFFTDRLINNISSKSGKIYVAEYGGVIVGFIGGYLTEQDTDELMEAKKERPGTIGKFFITAQYRGSGVGTQLLMKIEQHLKNQGCTIVRFDVFAPNAIARQFYSKHGYQDRTIIISKSLA